MILGEWPHGWIIKTALGGVAQGIKKNRINHLLYRHTTDLCGIVECKGHPIDPGVYRLCNIHLFGCFLLNFSTQNGIKTKRGDIKKFQILVVCHLKPKKKFLRQNRVNQIRYLLIMTDTPNGSSIIPWFVTLHLSLCL